MLIHHFFADSAKSVRAACVARGHESGLVKEDFRLSDSWESGGLGDSVLFKDAQLKWELLRYQRHLSAFAGKGRAGEGEGERDEGAEGEEGEEEGEREGEKKGEGKWEGEVEGGGGGPVRTNPQQS